MSTSYKDSFKNLETDKLSKTRRLKFVANLNESKQNQDESLNVEVRSYNNRTFSLTPQFNQFINVMDADTGELIEGITRVEINTSANGISTATITIEILPSDLNFGGNVRVVSGNG